MRFALLLGALVLAGCASTPALMPTPNIYLGDGGYPGSTVPRSLRSNEVDLLFVTDRAPEKTTEGALAYGTGRSAAQFRDLINRRMAKTGQNEVHIFVHGYNNSFDWAAASLTELWHFIGRRGVPLLYS